jgi:hypothetical protein
VRPPRRSSRTSRSRSANIVALNQGYDPDTVVVSDLAWANALSAFVAAGYFSREDANENPALTGDFKEINGLLWLVSPNLPTAQTALVLDSRASAAWPTRTSAAPATRRSDGVGVEVKSIRDDDNDGQWKLRARRVTVPIVLEPAAAWKLTGLGV